MQQVFNKAFKFVKEKHAGQHHANDVPVSQHLYRVSQILKFSLNKFKESSKEERDLIVLSSLGHDLLEDTKSLHTEIKKVSPGPLVGKYLEALFEEVVEKGLPNEREVLLGTLKKLSF